MVVSKQYSFILQRIFHNSHNRTRLHQSVESLSRNRKEAAHSATRAALIHQNSRKISRKVSSYQNSRSIGDCIQSMDINNTVNKEYNQSYDHNNQSDNQNNQSDSKTIQSDQTD